MNLDNIGALIDMSFPKSKNEVQVLNERIAALSKFISISSDKCHRFFKVLKRKWTKKSKKAFLELTKHFESTELLPPNTPHHY